MSRRFGREAETSANAHLRSLDANGPRSDSCLLDPPRVSSFGSFVQWVAVNPTVVSEAFKRINSP